MRIPTMRTGNPVNTSRVSRNPGGTQPSASRMAGGTTGPQGTPGGKIRRPNVGRSSNIMGVEVYLWILVIVELALTGLLRKFFRRFHGG